MKRGILIAAFAFVAASAFAEKGLVVTQKFITASTREAAINVTWFVTDTKCKMKMEFRDDKVNTVTWFIPDVAGNNLLTYAEGAVPPGVEKAFFTIPLGQIQANRSMNTSSVSVTRTGETKTISGFLCEKIITKTTNSVTEMWVTKDFKADYYKYYPFFQSSFELKSLSEEKIQGFPLVSVTKDLSGAVMSSYELVSATQQELAADSFTIPSEYKSAEGMSKGKK